MIYKDEITAAMNMLSEHRNTVFMGYNVRYGGKAGGSLNCIPEDRLMEMPLAENLMAGAAIGLSLEGYVPVLWVERADFLTCCMDAIVNHLNHLGKLSNGLHKPGVIIRVCVGNSETPLYTGPTHTQCFAQAMRCMLGFPVVTLRSKDRIQPEYQRALCEAIAGRSTMLFEYKDLYGK